MPDRLQKDPCLVVPPSKCLNRAWRAPETHAEPPLLAHFLGVAASPGNTAALSAPPLSRLQEGKLGAYLAQKHKHRTVLLLLYYCTNTEPWRPRGSWRGKLGAYLAQEHKHRTVLLLSLLLYYCYCITATALLLLQLLLLYYCYCIMLCSTATVLLLLHYCYCITVLSDRAWRDPEAPEEGS